MKIARVAVMCLVCVPMHILGYFCIGCHDASIHRPQTQREHVLAPSLSRAGDRPSWHRNISAALRVFFTLQSCYILREMYRLYDDNTYVPHALWYFEYGITAVHVAYSLSAFAMAWQYLAPLRHCSYHVDVIHESDGVPRIYRSDHPHHAIPIAVHRALTQTESSPFCTRLCDKCAQGTRYYRVCISD